MDINIYDVKGENCFTLSIENGSKIPLSNILDKLAEQENLKRDGMRLFFKGKFLDENSTFESLKINEDSVLQLYSPYIKYDQPKVKFDTPSYKLAYSWSLAKAQTVSLFLWSIYNY